MKSLFPITIAFFVMVTAAGCSPTIEGDQPIGLEGGAESAVIDSSAAGSGSIDNSALRIAGSNDQDGVAAASTGDQSGSDEVEEEHRQDPSTPSTGSNTTSEANEPSTATTGSSSDRTEAKALVVKPTGQSPNPAVTGRQTTTSTTSRSTTTTQQTTTSTTGRSTTTTRQTIAAGVAGGRFETLPPGASLPSGSECAARVRPAAEVRSMNDRYNSTRGTKRNGYYTRVDGNYVGTTDEIIQWAACKWGIDEDWARAQVAKESWWDMRSAGDRTSDQNACHPDLRTGSGTCPESVGLMQVRYLYHREAFEDANAIRSSAYNVDYGFAVWRACYNGELTWLNTVDRGATYGAGDLEGCLGVWFTGRWYVDSASPYIAEVRRLKNSRIWEQSDFLGYKG